MNTKDLKKLISIRSIHSNPEGLQKVVQFVENYFKGIEGLYIRRYKKDNKPSIVISFRDTITPHIIMNGHLDVVPGPDNIFELHEDEGIVHGRGVYDMKGNVLMMMEVMKHFAEEGRSPSLALMITTDEEVGGNAGVKYLIEEEGYRCKLALIPDGSKNLQVIHAEKGQLFLEMTSRGKTGHGSRPWLGDNAILRLYDNIKKVQKVFPMTYKMNDNDYWYPSFNITSIHGGSAFNQTPEIATARLDIRFTEKPTKEEIIIDIQQVIDEFTEVKIVKWGELVFVPKNHPYVQLYLKTSKKIIGKDVEIMKECGGSDGLYFAREEIPVILTNVEGGAAHSNNEWANLQSFDTVKEIYIEFIKAFKV